PKYSGLFTDPEEPGKGRFLNCPSGWVCEKTNSRLLQLHGLHESYTNFRAGTGAALDAAISSAYDREQPILFYYCQPAGLMAKYKFHKIEQDPFNQQCWDTIVSGKGELCSSDFLLARLAVAVSTPFAKQNPELVAFFEKLQFKPELLNRMILEMTETRAGGEAMADRFLREHPQVWHAWLPPDVIRRVNAELSIEPPTDRADAQPDVEPPPVADGKGIFPDWSVAAFVNQQLMGVVKNYGGVFRQASNF